MAAFRRRRSICGLREFGAPDLARAKIGGLPIRVSWRRCDGESMPEIIRCHLDETLAEGVAWKFAPLRLFPDRLELALDNDCILWRLPDALSAWLDDKASCVLAEDVVPALGQFARMCGDHAEPGYFAGSTRADVGAL